MPLLTVALFVAGYPTAVVVISRFVPVVRERRRRWFAAHQLAVGAIVAGWTIKGDPGPVIVNGAWLAVATGWWVSAGRSKTIE